ncbi:hypothetical protein SAMN04487894_11792 [Niabella drilacis]|uniref:Uncharacterized protein n=1 Tax=Niabella drilacis (strain DSM 25811 / CCM 8410 / CCUG 62505 / LMG 26954 / E90) TaxID=1285928 RepID=A0A1G6Z852_NIADE|nr:hypothetical protein SAMN04487894_11792 [Niabella drilacis]
MVCRWAMIYFYEDENLFYKLSNSALCNLEKDNGVQIAFFTAPPC